MRAQHLDVVQLEAVAPEVRRRPRQHQRARARGVVEHRLGHERPADRDAVEAGHQLGVQTRPRTSGRSRRRGATRRRRRGAPRSTLRAARASARSGASPRRTTCRCAGRRRASAAAAASFRCVARPVAGSPAGRARTSARGPSSAGPGPSGSSRPRTHGGGSPARARRPPSQNGIQRASGSSSCASRSAATSSWPRLATNPTASTSRSAIRGGRRGSSGSAPKAVGKGAEARVVAAEAALGHLEGGEVVQRRADRDLLQVDQHRLAGSDPEVAGVRIGMQQRRRSLQRIDEPLGALIDAAVDAPRRQPGERIPRRCAIEEGGADAVELRQRAAHRRRVGRAVGGRLLPQRHDPPVDLDGPLDRWCDRRPGGRQVVGQLDQVGAAAVDPDDAGGRAVDGAARGTQQHERAAQPERRPRDRCQLAHV